MATNDSSSSWRLEKHTDQLCDAFEAELRAGKRPKISDYLARSQAGDAESILAELLVLELEYRDRMALPWSAEEYLAQFDHAVVTRVIEGYRRRADRVPGSDGEETKRRSLPEAGTDEFHHVSVKPGAKIGQYELGEQIGAGGMGVVYRARQVTTDRDVALKFVNSHQGGDSNAPSIQRFLQEPKAAAQLEHEHIVTVYEVGSIDGLPFFSMRLIDGPSLRDVTQEGPLNCRTAASYLKQIASAIQHAHEHHILHRDIKPGNILIGADDRPYITDFGMAKSLNDDLELTQDGIGLGTIGYVSPEQAESGAKANPQSDIYSLGATLYCLITGRPPFQAANPQETLRQVRETEPVPPGQLNVAVDRDLETICLKCLAKEPKHRYATAGDLAADLERYLNDEPILARPVGAVTRVWRWSKRHRLVSTLSAALALLLIVLAIAGPLTAFHFFKLNARQRQLIAQSYFEQANLAAQRGAWQLALENLERSLVEGYPDPYEIRISQIRALQAAGRVGESEHLLDELRAVENLGPHHAEVLLLTGDDLLRRDQVDEGSKLIGDALSAGLDGADAAYARGMLAENSLAALEQFEQATSLDPYHHDALGAKLLCQFALGHLEAATNEAAALTHLYPDDPSFPIALAWVAAIHGDRAAADRYLEQTRDQLDGPIVEDLQRMCGHLAELDTIAANWDAPSSRKLATEILQDIGTIRHLAESTVLRLPPSLWPDVKQLTWFSLQSRIAPKMAAKTLSRTLNTHPEGTLYFVLGLLHLQQKQPKAHDFQSARDAFATAADAPAILPSIHQEALYAQGMCEAGLFYAKHPDALSNAVTHLRQYRELGQFPNRRLATVFGVALGARDLHFAQLLVLDMENQNYQKAKRSRAKLDIQLGNHTRAAQLLEEMLAETPDDKELQKLFAGLEKQSAQPAE